MFTDPKIFRQRIGQCLSKDRHRLVRMLDRLLADQKTGLHLEGAFEALEQRLLASEALVDRRVQSIPKISYPELPVSERRQDILNALMAHQVIIVCGETGSGKTTQLPKICLEAGRGRRGFIGHTQPRRIAARAVAMRIAEEMGQPLGQAVGYKVRFQDQSRPESLIKLMTDGILLAETPRDRFLDAYDTLIVDEAHERSLNIDFLLGYLKWLLPRRPDLKVVITSATIDPERFSKHFDDAPILHVSGRSYPVDLRYRPVEVEEGDETDHPEQQAILDAVDELWRENPGDILIFLSGEREIRETHESLKKHHPSKCEILPLYSRLSQSEQEKVFKPIGQRRIVLSTNVAETSLTVPGIRSVIDTGYARISRYSHRSKLQRLPIEKISQASAHQRSGRCGRVGPGIAIRLYSEEDFINRPEFTDPEILRTNLAAVILQMHALRLGDIARFPFVEPPDERLIRDGLRTLQELNALNERNEITPIGRGLAKLPVDPRLGRMLIAARDENCLCEIATIASALSVPDPRERPQDRAPQADQKHARFKDERSDFVGLLNLWRDFHHEKQHRSRAKLRQYCRDSFLSFVRMSEWQDVHSQIMEVIKGDLGFKMNEVPADYPEIHRALLSGLLSNVALKQEQNDYLGARGVRLHIHPGSYLFKVKPKWIISQEQIETTKVYGRTVAAIEPEWIESIGAHLIKSHYYDPHWERKAGRVAVHERTQLFSLIIQSGRKIPYERVNPKEAREMFIRHALVQMDYESRAPFFLHNLKLLEEADYLQQKGRRVDLLVDEAWLTGFFDQRIPADVVSGVTFEKWRKLSEAKDPGLLKLTADDITVKVDATLDAVNFPDHCQIGSIRIPLQYRFEPGHEEDGVTALMPLHLLNTLDEAPFRWLVPGMLREKLVALIKSLPKTLRIHFVPVPDYADRILPMLDIGRGSLYGQLSMALKKTGGIAVGADAFREDILPNHLRMTFKVIDVHDRIIDQSRDLEVLKRRHSGDAGKTFQKIASQAYLHTGLTHWSFGDLGDSFDGEHEGQKVYGFPAVVDEGETIGVRVFESPEAAAQAHELGVSRLLRIVLLKEIKYIKRQLVIDAATELSYRQLQGHPFLYSGLAKSRELREDLLDRLVASVFLEGQPILRSAGAFDDRVRMARSDLLGRADQMAEAARKILDLYRSIQKALAGPLSAVLREDIEKQLGRMIYQGFWVTTSWLNLCEMPRYLGAILNRLQKAPQDPQKDLHQLSQIAPFLECYWTLVEREQGRRYPERDAFRWLLEEFRVSLFAQQLKTLVPVSGKRMADGWALLNGKT